MHIHAHARDFIFDADKRGDTLGLTESGVKVNLRERDTKAGQEGQEHIENADVVVLATGFERPSLDCFPDDLFPEDEFGRPDRNLILFRS